MVLSGQGRDAALRRNLLGMVVVNVVDIVAISVVGRATVTMNVLGELPRRLAMSKPLSNEVVPSLRVTSSYN